VREEVFQPLSVHFAFPDSVELGSARRWGGDAIALRPELSEVDRFVLPNSTAPGETTSTLDTEAANCVGSRSLCQAENPPFITYTFLNPFPASRFATASIPKTYTLRVQKL